MCSVNSVIFCAVFSDVKSIMLCGIESHVCVQLTVLYSVLYFEMLRI